MFTVDWTVNIYHNYVIRYGIIILNYNNIDRISVVITSTGTEGDFEL